MTDNEIIKALSERTHSGKWIGKGFLDKTDYLLLTNALYLINRQQAEIERLNGCVKSEGENRAIMKAQMEPMIKEATNEMFDRAVKVARADAVIDFAESFKKLSGYSVKVDGDREIPGTRHYSISEISLDKLVKEKLDDANIATATETGGEDK